MVISHWGKDTNIERKSNVYTLMSNWADVYPESSSQQGKAEKEIGLQSTSFNPERIILFTGWESLPL
jgi:hypothetical protein